MRTENDNNGFFVHAAHHHGVGEEEERGTGVELFKWDEVQFLDADRHWKRRKIKESLYTNAYKAKQKSSLMNLEQGAWVDPCWGALNDLILKEGERGVKARQKWLGRFGNKKLGKTRAQSARSSER